MSALTPAGSTAQWRRLVAYVFERKGRACQMLRDGRPCHAYATTVQHVVRREHGGTDRLGNLIPACGPCNYGERPPDVDDQVAPLAPALGPRAAAVVDALDALGLPAAAGTRAARRALERRLTVIHVSGAVLRDACAYRRARGPLIRL